MGARLFYGFLFASMTYGGSAFAAECRLRSVKDIKQAELVVYFTRFPKEDQTKAKYKNCRIVKGAVPNAKSFFVTQFRPDANVVVLRENWPRS